MNFHDALAILGATPESSAKSIRTTYFDLMRQHHPDVATLDIASGGPSLDPAILTEAYAVVLAEFSKNNLELGSKTASRSKPMSRISDAVAPVAASHDGDTILIEAPADEAYQRLLDAAAGLGGIGHVDRSNEILEVIVRFDGGPSCSLLMTLHGRVDGTGVFCELESIEALATPPLTPVLDALVNLLNSPTKASAT